MSHDNIPSDPWRTDQFLLYATQGKTPLSYSHGIVPALKIYSNVAIKRRPQVNTETNQLLPDISSPRDAEQAIKHEVP